MDKKTEKEYQDRMLAIAKENQLLKQYLTNVEVSLLTRRNKLLVQVQEIDCLLYSIDYPIESLTPQSLPFRKTGKD